jgi:hypothetical protein
MKNYGGFHWLQIDSLRRMKGDSNSGTIDLHVFTIWFKKMEKSFSKIETGQTKEEFDLSCSVRKCPIQVAIF